MGMPFTPMLFPPSSHTQTHTHSVTPPPSTAQASASRVLKHTLAKHRVSGTLLKELRSLTGQGPIFSNMLLRCLKISSEGHYFFPKWNFSWKAIKIEGIKIFTGLIRLHTSSGLIHNKQENNKRHLNTLFPSWGKRR